MFIIEKKFIGGILKGITIHEKTQCDMKPNSFCMKPIGGSPYVIKSVKKLA